MDKTQNMKRGDKKQRHTNKLLFGGKQTHSRFFLSYQTKPICRFFFILSLFSFIIR